MSFKIVGVELSGAPREEGPVFVCICRAVTLRAVTEAIEAGATSPDAVETACGAGGDCGTCRGDIACILRELLLHSASGSRAA